MSHILIEWKDNDTDRSVMTMEGRPVDLIVAVANALAEITRKVGNPERLNDMVVAVSQEYTHRVFSENLTSVGFDVDGGEHQ